MFAVSPTWLRSVKRAMFVREFRDTGSLYSDNFEQQFPLALAHDLISEFGPISEGRYYVPPFEVQEMAIFGEHNHCRLPNAFAAEHAESLRRLDATAESVTSMTTNEWRLRMIVEFKPRDSSSGSDW